jgi:hypothetical protein
MDNLDDVERVGVGLDDVVEQVAQPEPKVEPEATPPSQLGPPWPAPPLSQPPMSVVSDEEDIPKWLFILGPVNFIGPICWIIALILFLVGHRQPAEGIALTPFAILAFYWVMMLLIILPEAVQRVKSRRHSRAISP